MLENDILEAVLGTDGANAHRTGHDVADDGNLAVQPAVVDHEFADVVDHQLQQVEQAGAQFGPVLGQELQPIGEALECGEQFLYGLQETVLRTRVERFRASARSGSS